MIPQNIFEAFEKSNPNPKGSATSCLRNLGISESSQFGEFHCEFWNHSLLCDSSGSKNKLFDLEEICDFLDYLHTELEVPDEYISLDSMEGEGFYLYNRKNESVYDVNFSDINNLIEGKHPPKWKDFYAFLEWYITPEDD